MVVRWNSRKFLVILHDQVTPARLLPAPRLLSYPMDFWVWAKRIRWRSIRKLSREITISEVRWVIILINKHFCEFRFKWPLILSLATTIQTKAIQSSFHAWKQPKGRLFMSEIFFGLLWQMADVFEQLIMCSSAVERTREAWWTIGARRSFSMLSLERKQSKERGSKLK